MLKSSGTLSGGVARRQREVKFPQKSSGTLSRGVARRQREVKFLQTWFGKDGSRTYGFLKLFDMDSE